MLSLAGTAVAPLEGQPIESKKGMNRIELENNDFRKKHVSIFVTIWALVMLGGFVGVFLEWWPHSTIFIGLVVGIAIAIRGAALGLWRWSDICRARSDSRKSL